MTFHTFQQYKSRTVKWRRKSQKMLLLADNHAVCPHTQDLPNVTPVFLSQNATFDLQLMNVEVMASGVMSGDFWLSNWLNEGNKEMTMCLHLTQFVWWKMHGTVLLFTRKNFINKTVIYQGHVQKGLHKWLYINHCDISWPLVSYSIIIFSCENPRKHRIRPWWTLNQQMKVISKWNIPLISCTAKVMSV